MANFLDLTGRKFGRLTVVKFSKDVKSGKRDRKYWLCKCECGKTREIRTDSLTSGNVKSCGCLKKEQDIKNLTDKFRFKPKYKIQNKRLYGIWSGMILRCTDKRNKRYDRYGQRGISVFKDWFDYDVFSEWAINNGYSEELTIDRIDNDGNYEPCNCRWVDNKTQCRNRSSNVFVEYNNKRITLIELSEILDINYSVIYSRYSRGLRGDNLFEPVKSPEEVGAKLSKHDVVEIRNKYSQGYSIKKISEIYPVSYKSISNVVHRKTWKNI